MIRKILPVALPITDYWMTLRFTEFLFDWLIPLCVGVVIYVRTPPALDNFVSFNGTVINLLAILVGFSITGITIFSTNDGSATARLKQRFSDRSISGTKLSLFQLLHLTLTYSLVVELITLVLTLSFSYLSGLKFGITRVSLFYSIDALLVMHVLAVNFRNVTRIYFVFWQQPENE